MKKLNGIFTILLFIFSLSNLCYSAPNLTKISGTINSGQTVTITGSGFGTHENYNEGNYKWMGLTPIAAKFKDFNDGSITSGGWYNGFPAQNSIVTGGRVSGGKYLKEQSVSDERSQVQYTMSKTNGKFYVSFWFMMPPNTQSGKFWRIYGSGSAANIYLSTGCESNYIRGYSECSAASCNPSTEWGTGTQFTSNTWHRVDIWMDQATNTFTVYKDGVQQWTKSNWVASQFGGNGHTMDFGNMINDASRGCGTAGSYNYDDIFVNYTKARVEFCDGSSWANRGKCEVQIPLSWNSSNVTFGVNSGSFTTGQKAYLYVVDSNGAANATGYALTIGNESPSPTNDETLQAPRDPRVVQ